MSIDNLIANLLTGVTSLEAALTKNSSYLERVIAGQEAAMAKLEGTKAPTTRASKAAAAAAPAAEPVVQKTAETPAPEPKPAEPVVQKTAETPAPEPKPAELSDALTQDDIKTLAMKWRASTEDEGKRANQHKFLTAMMTELGVTKLTGPDGPTDPMDIKKAVFWIDRAMAGHKVDFNADYDFDGSPEQGVAAPAPAVDDEMFG